MKGGNKIKKIDSTQNWLTFDKIFYNGVVQYKNYYIKVLRIIPIEYDLKSNLEKQAILNSYKVFLKTCNFDSQILIQSKKENLSKHLSQIKDQEKNYHENEFLDVFKNYYTYISNLNKNNKSASKNYFLVIKSKVEAFKSDDSFKSKEIFNQLNEMSLKIKESLSRCGNSVLEIRTKDEIEEVFNSFYNPKKIY